jgi:hypothetical protein
MKRTSITFLLTSSLFLICFPFVDCTGQDTITIGYYDKVVAPGTTDTAWSSPADDHWNYILCGNSTFLYHATGCDTVIMEPFSTLIINSSQLLVVYMSQNCTLIYDSVYPIPVRHIWSLFYDPSGAVFIDTSCCEIFSISAVPGLTFQYPGYAPGGTPCNDIFIEEGLINKMQFYPNPASDMVRLQLPQSFGRITVLEIFNSIGQLQAIQEIQTKIDISFFKNGLYFFVVTNKYGERLVGKVIKE